MNTSIIEVEKGKWKVKDADGTQWICSKKPFYNGAKWFVKLEKWNENLEDFMTKVEEAKNDKI